MSTPSFHLLSSTRYDRALLDLQWNTDANEGVKSPYLLLKYHFDRLRDALKQHGWPSASGFTRFILQSHCDAAVEHALAGLAWKEQPLKVLQLEIMQEYIKRLIPSLIAAYHSGV